MFISSMLQPDPLSPSDLLAIDLLLLFLFLDRVSLYSLGWSPAVYTRLSLES